MRGINVDPRLQSAVRLIRDLFVQRAHRSGVTPAVVDLTGASEFAVAGFDESALIEQLDSTQAFVFLEDLERRYTVILTDVRQLLLDRLADPWPPA